MRKKFLASVLFNIVLLVIVAILLSKYVKEKSNNLETTLLKIESEKKKINIIDKTDLIYVFNSRKFPCDSKYTSLEINLCSQKKLQFADSLLSELVKRELNKLDNYIKNDKEVVLKGGENSFFVNCLRINTAQKEEFLKSQKYWEESRKLNSKIKSIGCDKGIGCVALVNDAEIDDVLNRIKKIQELGLGCN